MSEKKAVNKVRKKAKPVAETAAGESEMLAKIAAMPEPYRSIGERLHQVIRKAAPDLKPRVRYGMPWYMKDGKSCCFFRAATDFGFVTLGFDDFAKLTREQGTADQLVASAFRITVIDEATEAKLAAIVRRAGS